MEAFDLDGLDSDVEGLSLLLFPVRELVDAPLSLELLEFGLVKGRKPSLEFLSLSPFISEVTGRLPTVDGPRASFGDIVGARYSPPAALAGMVEWLLKSPALAVAAIAGRPWFSDAKFCRF